MPDSVHRIPLAQPFTATERGRYQPMWRDGTWSIEPCPNDWDGFELRAGDTITAITINDPAVVIERDPQQEPDGRLLLGLPTRGNDAGAETVRDYLVALVRVAMDIKRPFGNSGWIYDLYEAFGEGGLLEIERDEDGYIKDFDRARADELVQAAIDALGSGDA